MIYQLVKKAMSYSDMKNILKNESKNILATLDIHSIIHQSLVASHMYGRYLVIHESEDIIEHSSPEPKAISLPMSEAIEYWKKKVPISPKKFYDLAEEYRVNAFTVSGVGRHGYDQRYVWFPRKIIN